MKNFNEGDRVYVGGRSHIVVGQVLFNQPAYRVMSLNKNVKGSYVCDGNFMSEDPSGPGLEHALNILKRTAPKGMDLPVSDLEIFD